MQGSVSVISISVSLIVSSRKEYNQVLMKTIYLLREKYYRRDLCVLGEDIRITDIRLTSFLG